MSLGVNTDFEKNYRRKQEVRMRPYADFIYRYYWGDDIKIERIEHQADYVLDRYFAIDTIITMPNGMILTGQEKFLSHKYAGLKTVTVEYMNDPVTKKEGDWFHLACQFYFCGYINRTWDGFYPWVILDWPNTVLATHKSILKWIPFQNAFSKASGQSCKMNDIKRLAPECIIRSNL